MHLHGNVRTLSIAIGLLLGSTLHNGTMAQTYSAGQDAARRAAEQASQERARAAAAQMDQDRQRLQREQADAQRRQQSTPPTTWSSPGGPSERPVTSGSLPERPRPAISSTNPAPSAATPTAMTKEQADREAQDAFNAGLDMFLKGNSRGAQNMWQKSVDLRPDNADVRHLLVVAMSRNGELTSARAHCMILVSQVPDRFSYFDPQGEMGDTCRKRGR